MKVKEFYLSEQYEQYPDGDGSWEDEPEQDEEDTY